MPTESAVTVTNSKRFIDLADQWGAHNYHPLDVVLSRGEGCWVFDVEGNRYLDCLAAYSAVNQGHCHPRIVEALTQQAAALTLTSRAFHNDQMGPFLEQLCELMGYARALPMNTGAEAVETAIKMTRKWGYQVRGVAEDAAEIIVMSGNFHGRTTAIVGFSTDPQARDGFGPFAPGFKIVPYGDVDALAAAFGPNTVGVLAEPIQGEAGVVMPPDGFLTSMAELCRDHKALMVADEVQTGLGRTGKLLATQWENVRPDVLILGKALGGGVYPVSAVLADDEIMDVFSPGDHGSTFGGNPLAAAVAREALAILADEGLVDNARELGDWFMDELRAMDSPHVAEVRGRGLMVGVVVHDSSGPARPFCKALARRGILAKETHEQVIRFAPPLVVTREILQGVLPDIHAVLHGEDVDLA
ncbi:MAG TPA: ornithine--oxo-acid transaminase [Acidobacteriota bacterium]|nr:ornithine--oxo-acid transaminase [Acidobacteriota bacterium]